MNRTDARKAAVGIINSIRSTGAPAEEVLEDFFQEDYYSTLSSEDTIFTEAPKTKNLEYIKNVVKIAVEKEEELSAIITANAKRWKENRISDIASSVLRCALAEIIYIDDIPVGASVKDAVDITKYYDDEKTADFVNAVLRSYLRSREEKTSAAEE